MSTFDILTFSIKKSPSIIRSRKSVFIDKNVFLKIWKSSVDSLFCKLIVFHPFYMLSVLQISVFLQVYLITLWRCQIQGSSNSLNLANLNGGLEIIFCKKVFWNIIEFFFHTSLIDIWIRFSVRGPICKNNITLSFLSEKYGSFIFDKFLRIFVMMSQFFV